jgi:hypothetical protein
MDREMNKCKHNTKVIHTNGDIECRRCHEIEKKGGEKKHEKKQKLEQKIKKEEKSLW